MKRVKTLKDYLESNELILIYKNIENGRSEHDTTDLLV